MANGSSITGGSQSSDSPQKGKRFLSDLIDLFGVPILLGVIVGFILIVVPDETVRNIILIVVNIGWLIFRDVVFSLGRLVGLKLISLDGSKVTFIQGLIRNVALIIPVALVSGYFCEIARVFFGNLLWRRVWHITLAVIFLLAGLIASIAGRNFGFLIGLGLFSVIYIIVTVTDTESRPPLTSRRIWYSITFFLSLLVGLGTLFSEQPGFFGFVIKIGAVIGVFLPPFFLFKDKESLSSGDRLMDVYAKTRVVNA